MTWENIVTKEEIGSLRAISPFVTKFAIQSEIWNVIYSCLLISSADAFNLEQSQNFIWS